MQLVSFTNLLGHLGFSEPFLAQLRPGWVMARTNELLSPSITSLSCPGDLNELSIHPSHPVSNKHPAELLKTMSKQSADSAELRFAEEMSPESTRHSYTHHHLSIPRVPLNAGLDLFAV